MPTRFCPFPFTRPPEPLEPRLLFCLNHVGGAAAMSLFAAPATQPAVAGADLAASGLPLLHSLPGAPASLFLDFDGYGAFEPYDTDGEPQSFAPAEQAAIREAWRQVASYFAMFELDVTTELPAGGPYSYSLISNSTPSGTTSGSFPSVTPVSQNPSIDARSRLSSLAHEAGHAFGLSHQSDYDRLGTKINEYSSGPDPLHGPIMGVDFAGAVHKWLIGHPSSSASDLQDDVAVIASRIAIYSGGDGMRADDVPGALPQARPLLAAGPGAWGASGIIERLDSAYPVRGPNQVKVAARFGDVNGSGGVDATDVMVLRRAVAVRTAVPSLLLDLDLSGAVSAADVVLARRRLATVFA
jgi:hypothetical protein